MLEVRQLTKRYSGIPVVDHVTFQIRPGEILGYLGPNGAGKSTTVKMLTGLMEPTSGRRPFHGKDIRQDLKGFQRRIGYVPEEPHLYPHLSGREYLQLAGRLRGMRAPRARTQDGRTAPPDRTVGGPPRVTGSATPRACARRSSCSPLCCTTRNC